MDPETSPEALEEKSTTEVTTVKLLSAMPRKGLISVSGLHARCLRREALHLNAARAATLVMRQAAPPQPCRFDPARRGRLTRLDAGLESPQGFNQASGVTLSDIRRPPGYLVRVQHL